VLFFTGAAGKAKADFVGYYAPGNFTLTNYGGLFPNGFASSPEPSIVILTGTNDGSGLPGSTELTILSPSSGFFEFNYDFATLDTPGYEDAGYIIGSTFYQLANTNGESGSVMVSVLAGEEIGFEVASLDNTGTPGIFTISDFSGPSSPEPGSLAMLLFGVAAFINLRGYLRRKQLPSRIMVLVAAGGMGAAFMSAPAFAQTYPGSVVTGQLAFTNVVNLTQQGMSPSGAQTLGVDAPPAGGFLKANPLLQPPQPPAKKQLGAQQLAAAPPQGLSVVQASGVFGFNALSHLDQLDAYGGNQFNIEPPNQSIAVGNGYVLEGVNDAVQVFSTTGSPALPMVLAANQVFGLPPAINRSTLVYGVYLTDMRVFYDTDINRWFVVMRSQDNTPQGQPESSSHLYMAVSQTGDPTANYNVYVMNTTHLGNPGCPCIDDYPQIGADAYGFHIAWNEYTPSGQQFVDASILSLSKADLKTGQAFPTAYQTVLTFKTGYEFAIQPSTAPPGAANFVGNQGVEYFASTITGFSANGNNALGVWAMSNTESLTTSTPSPSLSLVTVPVLTYTSPNSTILEATQPSGYAPLAANQASTIETLDSGDARVQSLSYAGAKLYVAFETKLADSNGATVVATEYAVLSPTFRNSVLAAQVLNQGYLLVNGNFLLRPSLAVNAQGAGAIAVTLVGSAGDYYPSAAFIPFQTSVVPTTLQIAAPGALPEDGFTGYPVGGGNGVARWGDYNTAVASSDGSVWMTVQYIGNYPRAQYANWNTYVVQTQP
jgi:hypothetical protein